MSKAPLSLVTKQNVPEYPLLRQATLQLTTLLKADVKAVLIVTWSSKDGYAMRPVPDIYPLIGDMLQGAHSIWQGEDD